MSNIVMFLGQLNEIRKSSLARIICDNSHGINQIQPLAFFIPDTEKNPVSQCTKGNILSIDLSYWNE